MLTASYERQAILTSTICAAVSDAGLFCSLTDAAYNCDLHSSSSSPSPSCSSLIVCVTLWLALYPALSRRRLPQCSTEPCSSEADCRSSVTDWTGPDDASCLALYSSVIRHVVPIATPSSCSDVMLWTLE